MSSECKKVSPSRLSPFARPFTLNRPTSSFALYPSHSLLSQSFLHHCLEGGGDPISTFPNTDANSYYPQYPSGISQVPVDVELLSGSESEFGEKQGSRVDYHGILRWKNENGTASMPYDASTEKGKLSKGFNLCGEATDRLSGKCIGMSREVEIQTTGGEKVAAASVSFPIEKVAAASVSFPILDFRATSNFSSSTEISWSSCDSNIASYESKLNASLSTVTNSMPALTSESLGTGKSYAPVNSVPLENEDSEGHVAVHSNNLFSHDPTRIKESHEIMDKDKSKEVFCDDILKDKSKDGKNGKPFINEVTDPLPMTNPELQGGYVAVDLILKLHGAEEVDPVENSCKMFDGNDSDLDSPCWKGTLFANQSISEVAGPGNTENLKSGREACSSLNPLAPQFFPSKEQGAHYCGNECQRDNYLYTPETMSSVVNLLCHGERLQNSATAGSSSLDLSCIVGTHCSSDLCFPEKERKLLDNSSSSSMPCLSCWVQALPEGNCFKSSSQPLMSPGMRSAKGIKDVVHNGSASVSLFASKHVFNSSPCKVGVPSDFTKAHGVATQSLSKSSGLDFQIVVNTMNELSELLMQNCNYLDSLNEHDHGIIKRIIDNLTVCIKNRVGKSALMPESSDPSTSCYVRKSADIQKCLKIELHGTRAKATLMSHKLGHQDEHESQMGHSTNFCERILDSFSTRKNIGTERAEYITQVIKKAPREHQIDEVTSRALFYRNLWLEANAQLCSMKHNTYVLALFCCCCMLCSVRKAIL